MTTASTTIPDSARFAVSIPDSRDHGHRRSEGDWSEWSLPRYFASADDAAGPAKFFRRSFIVDRRTGVRTPAGYQDINELARLTR